LNLLLSAFNQCFLAWIMSGVGRILQCGREFFISGPEDKT
jgi:hypothetical protein